MSQQLNSRSIHLTPDYTAPRTPPHTPAKKKRPPGSSAPRRPPQSINPTAKQRLVRSNLQHRLAADELTFTWQQKLYAVRVVDSTLLAQAARHFRPEHYQEVLVERNLEDWCGYPLCARDRTRVTSRYRISLKEQKVYDQTEQGFFCSKECLKRSRFYVAQLDDEPVWARTESTWKAVRVFEMDEELSQTILTVTTAAPTTIEVSATLRANYVHSLLSTLPSAPSEITIREKEVTTEPVPPHAPDDTTPTGDSSAIEGAAADAVEGFRVGYGRGTRTMVLEKEEKGGEESLEEILNKIELEKPPVDENDDEALVRDAMETMMMLKSLGLDSRQDEDADRSVDAYSNASMNINAELKESGKENVNLDVNADVDADETVEPMKRNMNMDVNTNENAVSKKESGNENSTKNTEDDKSPPENLPQNKLLELVSPSSDVAPKQQIRTTLAIDPSPASATLLATSTVAPKQLIDTTPSTEPPPPIATATPIILATPSKQRIDTTFATKPPQMTVTTPVTTPVTPTVMLTSPISPHSPRSPLSPLRTPRSPRTPTSPHAPPPGSPTSSRASKREKRAPPRPQMSFFGRVWTLLDRMVTPHTRLFLRELEGSDRGYEGTARAEREDGREREEEEEGMATRRNIFSEKILEAYVILRPQLLLTTYIESDLLRLIGTLRLADQSAVVLDPAENWALCLVFVRALAECIPRMRNELDQEDGRRYREAWARLGRTTEEADAFVRVVRVGATALETYLPDVPSHCTNECWQSVRAHAPIDFES
ncbi:hypothetical protein BC937DRAFT_88856, partial [Endogone sp. FLAS-F59071]